MKKTLWLGMWILMALVTFMVVPDLVQAASIYHNPHVSFSPDGQAWTTDAGEKGYEYYEKGLEVYTGADKTVPDLQEGQHIYLTEKTGLLAVEKWEVRWTPGQCIHGVGWEEQNFHNLNHGHSSCNRYYKNGWMAYCADCGERITMLFYMDRDTAYSLKNIPLNSDYYYLCPWEDCHNLEQGVSIRHECRNVSWNQYMIQYKSNSLGAVGVMYDSVYMYNNATLYEGKEITAETKLRKNTFYRSGYEFIGWNTKSDGSGEVFQDQQEILNLTVDNGKRIILYAQWKKSESTLRINPAGGKFRSITGITTIAGKYGTTYDVSDTHLTPPQGATVSFEPNGGAAVKDLVVKQYFAGWSRSYPFHGTLEGDVYTFSGKDGSVDTLTAIYEPYPITLPEVRKAGMAFGGWYRDKACRELVGQAGEQVLIARNTTLYAQWISLQLTAVNDYSVHGGSGAVDLTWLTTNTQNQTYRIYQQREGESWKQLQESTIQQLTVDELLAATGTSQRYTVSYSGLYTLTATGAQGSDYGNYTGGKGGEVQVTVFLQKGEILTCIIGTTSGYNGGGSGKPYGNGGGMTSISSNQKGLLLVAGGGGGASSLLEGGPGGANTSLTATNQGGSGGAGGGGGYRGGTAGQVQVHNHEGNTTKGGACYMLHRHEGKAEQSIANGCYTVKTVGEAECKVSNSIESYEVSCPVCGGWAIHYYNFDGHSACGQFNTGQYGSGGSIYCFVCAREVGRWGSTIANTTHTYRITVYQPGCGFDDINKYALSCPYADKPDGYVISASQAYGGSNYTNEDYCNLKFSNAGVNTGNGTVHIYLQKVECVDGNELGDVAAPDQAAPAAISLTSIQKTAVGSDRIKVAWTAPSDNGTNYYHKMEAYEVQKGTKVCESNTTRNLLVSGIKGYYYCLDKRRNTVVCAGNGSFQKGTAITVKMMETIQYLHIAAVDVAGNISGTIHIPIEYRDREVSWPVYTKQIWLEEEENAYKTGDKTWYVRADGQTTFGLTYTAWMDHPAMSDYQPNYTDFQIHCGTARQLFTIFTPSHGVAAGTYEYKGAELDKGISGSELLRDGVYTRSIRSNQCRDLTVTQKLILAPEYDGETLEVIPIAGVHTSRGIVYSDIRLDWENGVYIIGDGKEPEIIGMEELNNLQNIRGDEEQVYRAELSARDFGSGMKELYCEIFNKDNFMKRTIVSEDGQRLSITIRGKDELLKGDVEITVYAVDKVGNRRRELVDISGFSLRVAAKRILAPHEPVFKAGESGILQIDTFGYAQRVEVVYPREWTVLGYAERQILDYSRENVYLHQEQLQFMVPLELEEEAEYVFTVRAYKEAGEMLEEQATIKVKGSVLDELRTRLR